MTTRLPQVGGDDGDWGVILNTYLRVSHDDQGNLYFGDVSLIQPLGTASAGTTGKPADAGHVHPTTGLAKLSGATFTGYVAPTVVSLSFGTSITIDAALSNVFSVKLTASSGTIENPLNPTDGQCIRLRIYQDGTGTRSVSWGSAFAWGSAATAPTLSTAANAADLLGFEYFAALGKWVYLSAPFPQGY